MKNKIIVISICMLLTATILPVTGTHDKQICSSPKGIESVPILEFVEVKGGLLGVSVMLINSGYGTAENIQWEMNASGGLFFFPDFDSDVIDAIEPDESEIIKIWPALGFGRTTVTFYCIYEIRNFTYDMTIEQKQEWRVQPLIFWHLIPTFQPSKDWMEIDMENVSYFSNRTDEGEGVQLDYGNLNNMHNVRVVLGLDTRSQEIEYLGACKFTNGTGYLYEHWITKELIQSEEAHWEVELVDME